jgi:hypothetical protein
MVSCCVKAFMAAGLQAELIKLLEMIVLQDSAFSSNQNLQNLLIITALKSDPSRVADYVHRLDGFEPKAVAQVPFLTSRLDFCLKHNEAEILFDALFRALAVSAVDYTFWNITTDADYDSETRVFERYLFDTYKSPLMYRASGYQCSRRQRCPKVKYLLFLLPLYFPYNLSLKST